MENKKIGIGIIIVFGFSVFALYVFFNSWIASQSMALLVVALLVLSFLLLLLLFKGKRKTLSKEERAKRLKFSGVFWVGFGIICLTSPFVFGEEIRPFNHVMAATSISMGVTHLWQSHKLKNENNKTSEDMKQK